MSLIALRRRTLTILFAAVQLALPVALSVAHATASTGLGAPAHVEETSGSKCSAAHVDECIVCRHLSTNAAKSPAPPSIAARSAVAQPGAASALAARSLSPHAFQSRAPPDLSA
ncbi:MAG: hypothetical protein WEA80_02305 [Gemmatimonadaceae bacterium]